MIIGKRNAVTICKNLTEMAMEFSNLNETVELRDSFNIEASNIDINEFLAKIHAPEIRRDDIDETERLYRKFQDPISTEITSDIDTFINMIKSYSDKNETGVSDKLLFNLIEQIMQIEKDSLGGIYLKHMVKKIFL